MKIISKFKDYYDFHQGEFGVDPLKVLDRTEYYFVREFENFINEFFFFCGKWYFKGKSENLKYHKLSKKDYDYNYRFYDLNIIYKDDKIYWAEILNYKEIEKRKWNPDSIEIINQSNKAYFIYSHYDRSNNTFRKSTYYPNLKEIEFDKVLNSKDCYLQIEAYISKKDLDININPTDMNLFEQKGFDKKQSFRNKKSK